MRDKMFRPIAIAVLAAVSVGIIDPCFANSSDASVSNESPVLIADAMYTQQKTYKRVSRPMKRVAKRVAAKPACNKVKEVVIERERVIERPVIVEKEVEVQAPVVLEQETIQPAVVEAAQPVIINRYEKRRRSLIHLGLFPFNLLD